VHGGSPAGVHGTAQRAARGTAVRWHSERVQRRRQLQPRIRVPVRPVADFMQSGLWDLRFCKHSAAAGTYVWVTPRCGGERRFLSTVGPDMLALGSEQSLAMRLRRLNRSVTAAGNTRAELRA